MRTPAQERMEKYLKIITGIAVAVLIVLCGLLVREYQHLRRIDSFAARGSFLAALRAHGPVNGSDAGSVQTWMTFDYINHLFSLPPEYLRTSLTVTDSRYPRLTITAYAVSQHIERSVFLVQVQNAIRAYFTAQGQ